MSESEQPPTSSGVPLSVYVGSYADPVGENVLGAPHEFIEDDELPNPHGWCKCGRSQAATLHVVIGTNECTICLTRDWPADERGRVVDDCNICAGPSCEWHGKDYKDGFQHEVCHESHDHTRAEEGTY